MTTPAGRLRETIRAHLALLGHAFLARGLIVTGELSAQLAPAAEEER